MRGIEKIVYQILEEARNEQSKIQEQTHIEIEKIQGRTRERIAEIGKKNQQEIQAAIKRIEDLSQLTTDQKNRRAKLEAKEEMIGKIVDESYRELLDMEKEKYLKLIFDMVEKFALPKEGKIYFNRNDLNLIDDETAAKISEIAKAKGGNLTLAGEPKEIDRGFILTYGGIEENCTFKALMDSKKDELQDLIRNILFS